MAGDITGTLSVATLPSATATLVAPQLRTFAQRHPAVTIRLLEGSEQEIRDPELAKQPFVRGSGGCADAFMPIARQAGVEFDVAFDAREIAAALEIVRAGLGVSILPREGLPELPGVVVRPLVPQTVRHLGIAVSASASAPARAFLDQIAAPGTTVRSPSPPPSNVPPGG